MTKLVGAFGQFFLQGGGGGGGGSAAITVVKIVSGISSCNAVFYSICTIFNLKFYL